MPDNIRILIADDHAIVREGLKGLLLSEPGMELVGEAADGVEAVEQARALNPDVILLDLLMPRKGGIAAIAEIIEANPNARILVLTSFAQDKDILPALQAGATGYMLKDSAPQDLLRGIREVYGGGSSLHPQVARRVIRAIESSTRSSPEEPLTEREVEILKYVARGLSNQAIAAKLVISERTVRTHVGNILSKLHVANRTQAALYAIQEGWVDPNMT